MDRRSFLKTLTGGIAVLGLGAAAGRFDIASSSALAADFPDLAAVKGTDVKSMAKLALESLGGLGRFVKSGQTVLIKPNMGWAVGPEKAANTSPELISSLIENALALGAKKVSVFDNTCDNWKSAYSNSGLEQASIDAGAEVVPANKESYYQSVTVPGARYLKEVSYHELYLEADVVINVPVLKHHGGARMTAALKNLMGVVWDRHAMHRNGLDETIPELFLYKKPALNIVEAQRVMLTGGPRGRGDSKYLSAQMLLASADPVAIDAASAAIISEGGINAPGYIAQAEKLGLGVSDLSKLKIQRLTI
ncbi:MAG: DUF362 domain-containing protein [Deltaproteobacteria bacterium]|jgi:uncharacterized protein (DUF362 family)|nr:DUF362 domain-containing protein [Deltaproteobacteria bacterium]